MEEPNSLWPYPYSPKLRAEVCLRGGVKKQEGQSTLCPGVRPGLPCSETASAGRWRRESHRKGGGGLGPLSGPPAPAFCSIASSLSVCGQLRLRAEHAHHHLHHQWVPFPTASLCLCLQHTYSPQGPWIVCLDGPKAGLCPSSHLGCYGQSPGAGLRVNKKSGTPRHHGI